MDYWDGPSSSRSKKDAGVQALQPQFRISIRVEGKKEAAQGFCTCVTLHWQGLKSPGSAKHKEGYCPVTGLRTVVANKPGDGIRVITPSRKNTLNRGFHACACAMTQEEGAEGRLALEHS